MAYRFSAVIAVLVAAFGFLLFHLYELQLVKGGYYLARADSQATASVEAAARGAIYFTDSQGRTLPAAVDQNYPTIWASPKDISDPVAAATTLAPMLNIPESTLAGIFKKPGDTYETLVKKASDSVSQEVTGANIKGVYSDMEPQRLYPLGTVASQILGFVAPNSTGGGVSGRYGVEGFYNSTLADSNDITLTIDPNLQIEAEKVLDELVAANNATGGSVIIEDPATGKILAMGGDPSFDPNNYSASALANFLNTNVESQYEPGSIFKVLTMAAGIDAGKITPDTTYDDKGYVEVNRAHITNYDLSTHGAYGAGTTMTQVIEHSINTGAIYAENQTGNATFLSYLKKFGFDQKTGIDLPGEITGNISQLTSTAPQVDWDTAAYGQGASVTPIELVQAVASLANGGIMMRPYLNAALQPKAIGRTVSASTAAKVTQMMVDAVDLAQVANIDGYSLAGKTGSAFIPNPNGGGYLNELTDSYIGFGPTSDPKFIAFIRLDTVPVTSLAAESVVPAFRQLSQYIINYYNIPPDRTTDDVIPKCPDVACGQ